MYILGLHGGNHRTHDASACLLKDNQIIAFAEEERFIRQRRAFDKVPTNAIMYCLSQAGIKISDISQVVFGLSLGSPKLINQSDYLNEYIPKEIFGDYGDIEVKIFNHHLCHAASSFYCSSFEKSGILVVDGEGSGLATSIYKGDNNGFCLLKSYPVNQSLGYLYATIAGFLGLGHFGAGKLMGLSSYGKPRYLNEIGTIYEKVSKIKPNLAQDSQDWYINNANKLIAELGFEKPKFIINFDKNRAAKKVVPVFSQKHKDIASSVQVFLENKLVQLAKECIQMSGSNNLCISGGVALNCVANSVIQKTLHLNNIFIQPACEDSGISLGAALLALGRHVDYSSPCYGPSFDNKQIKSTLDELKLEYVYVNDPSLTAAQFLANNKVVGWFQGRMETGPRSLGARSILANPMSRSMTDVLNKCKGRELWRPFGPSVLEEEGANVFVDFSSTPFMLKSFYVKDEWKNKISAVVHVDGSTRPQSVNKKDGGEYYDLISEFFKITGIPLIINTSFNYNAEPIVCSPIDAIRTFYSSGIDVLILKNYVLEKDK